jgi:hypothetical protein
MMLSRHRAVPRQLPQVFTFHVLHGEHEPALVLQDLVDGGDVRVGQRRHQARLPHQAGAAIGLGDELRGKDLQGDEAVQAGVGGQPDLPHASGADEVVDAILADGLADHRLGLPVKTACRAARMAGSALLSGRHWVVATARSRPP